MALLEVKNIETYYGPILAIKGVSLDVEEGGIVTILGANGVGKTTVLKTISGVMRPEKGNIDFMGQRIEGVSPSKIVGLGLSQVPEGREIFPELTVRENIILGAYLRTDKDGIQNDLELVYNYFPVLEQRKKQWAGTMSGGERQMVAIARALMARPKLMLLDEPSLGLSPIMVKDTFEIIQRINKEQKTSILIVEQNALMALSVAHKGYVLESGRIVMEGKADKLMENEDVKEFYLGIQEKGIRGTKRWKRKKKWR